MTTRFDQLRTFIEGPQNDDGRTAGLALARSLADREDWVVVPESLRTSEGALLIMVATADPAEENTLICFPRDKPPVWADLFSGAPSEAGGLAVMAAPRTVANLTALQAALPNLAPVPLGLASSFGFGDRIGLATPGHVQAMQTLGKAMVPIFAQQSIREMERTERSPQQVMADATWGAFRAGWQGPVGADADHLKTTADVNQLVAAGFTFFTIDPSDHVDQQADNYTEAQLDAKFQDLLSDRVPGARDVLGLYAGMSFDLGAASVGLKTAAVKRAAVKYGRALAHIYLMAAHTAKSMAGRGFELEISVDETDQPTTVAEHLFLALELKRHDVPVVSLAPRFIGDFEKGVDFRGDRGRFEADLVQHAAIAQQYGPYKISLHSGSDKFGVYPLIGRIAKGSFHVKTAGTSYLEALRAASRVDPDFFHAMANYARERFETDRATYHISATLEGTPAPEGLEADERERLYLDADNGRQILHVTYGSVLTARRKGDPAAYRFRDRLYVLLRDHRRLHEQLLAGHLGKHLRLLGDGEG